MANQAFSESNDLMVGAGGVYFQRNDDANKLHFLGNVSEFNITTDVTTVEKYSSMNKKRELMASVTTQTQASGSMVLNEYNMYNLALGLYGTEGLYHQTGTNLVSETYTVPSVPGIVELKDADGNRLYNVTGVSISLANSIPSTASFGGGSSSNIPDPTAGGTITVNGGSYTGTTSKTYYIQIVNAPTAVGDLDGLQVSVASNAAGIGAVTGTGTSGSTTLSVVIDGITVDFTVTAADTFTATGTTFITFDATPEVSTLKEGVDYIIEEESIRAGLIKIKKGENIKAGDVISVTATVPEADFVTVSGASAGKIEGSLLFVGDPNQGNAVSIEAWKVSIRPDGDLTGLIGDDFGEFTLNFNVMSDYESHPDYPLYKVTKLTESADTGGKGGVYDPNE